jgi:adenosylhomocysteine nucleosidase
MPIADIAIVCALDIEKDAVLRAVDDPDRMCFRLGPFECHYVHIKRNGDERYPLVRAVVLYLGRMGNLASMQATTLLLREVCPSYVFLVGICGGFANVRPNYRLGDVVVSDKVYYYEPRKLWPDRNENRGVELFCPGGREYVQLSLCALAQEKNAEGVPLIQPSLAHMTMPYPFEDGEHFKPTVYVGVVCSGEKIIADQSFSEDLLKESADRISVEMEAAGVATACQDTGTPFLVVKAVSDFTDVNENWRPKQRDFAAQAAAAYTMSLITYPFDIPGGRRKTSQNPGLVLNRRRAPQFFLADFLHMNLERGVDIILPSYGPNPRHANSEFQNYPYNEWETAFDDVYCSLRVHTGLEHLGNGGKLRFEFDQKIQGGLPPDRNIILIGSSVSNVFTRETLDKFDAYYRYGDTKENDHGLVDRDNNVRFDARTRTIRRGGRQINEYVKDYALVSVFHDGCRSISILAGCRAFSQMLLGDWLVEGDTIEELSRHIDGCDFQLIIEVQVTGRSYSFKRIVELTKRPRNSSAWETVNLPADLTCGGGTIPSLL